MCGYSARAVSEADGVLVCGGQCQSQHTAYFLCSILLHRQIPLAAEEGTIIVVMSVLKECVQALWIPEPFSNCAEIFGLISAKDIANILLSLWMIIRYTSHMPLVIISFTYLTNWDRDYPPTVSSYTTAADGTLQRVFGDESQLAEHFFAVKYTLQLHVDKLAAFYSRFHPQQQQQL
jgi:hypothetical protein